MYLIYIIKSLKTGRFYIGNTENLEQRLKRHNGGLVRSTKNGLPWEVVHTENFNDRYSARQRELKIKSYKGGEAFKKLLK